MDDKKNHLKLWMVVGVVIVLMAVTVWFGRATYRHYKEKHSLNQAQAFLTQGDCRNAFLSVRQALLINATNVQACRIMAGLAERSRSPLVLDWRRRIAEIEPTVENKLLLASAGLHYQSPPFPLTAQILGELPGAATNLAAFHVVSAELALRMNHAADAQAHLEAATRLEPANQGFQLNLAVIRLGSTNRALADTARATLKQFQTDTNFGPPALRSLVADRLVQNDLAGARDYSTQLLAGVQATLGDRLQHLGILRQLHSAELTAELESVQRQSATNALAAAAVASWMRVNGFLTDTIHWLTNLTANIQTQQPVRLALVDGYLAQTNWVALRNFTARSDWDEMEFLRLAFLSHAWFQLGESLVARSTWRAAVGQAGGRGGALTALLELADRWGLEREREDLLWQIVRIFPKEKWAGRELEHVYFAAGETRKLNQLYATWLPFAPDDTDIKNNLAATSLLLKTNLIQAYAWAKEVYAQKPNDPFVVSTYAYALHLQGRTREGVAALEKLKEASLEQPAVALYHGVLLLASGESDKGAHFLALVKAQGRLLPEEKRLLVEAGKAE